MDQRDMNPDVLGLVRRWEATERANDAQPFEQLLTDDFVLVGPLGFMLTKEQMVDRFQSGDLHHAAFDCQDPRARDYGDAAVVIGTQVQQSTYRGQEASGRFRVTLVAVRHDGGWKLAGIHLSPIAAPR